MEAYLERFPAVLSDPELKFDLVFSELRNHARARGGTPDLAEFIARFPELGDDLIRQFEVAEWLETRQGGSDQGSIKETLVDRDEVLLRLAVRMDFLSQGKLESLRQELGMPETGTLVRALLERGILSDQQNELARFTSRINY